MRYREYKKVDLPWLDEVPSHWEVSRIKKIFYIFKDISYKENPVVLSLARDKVKIRNIENNQGQLASSYNNYNTVKIGDLLLNPMDLYSGANCNISYYNGVISPAYINLRTKEYVCIKYFDYLFKLQYTSLAFQSVGKGVSKDNRWTLSNDTLLNYQIIAPPKEEQEQIARFLDWKINEIDRLILLKKSKLNELDKYIQIVIDEIYDSITNYEEVKLKNLGDFLKSGNLSRSDEERVSKYSALLYGDIYTKYNFVFDEVLTKINKKAYYNNPIINGNTLFFTTSGETRDEIGKCVLYIGDKKIAVGGDLVVFKASNKVSSKYLTYVLNTSEAINYRYVNGRGEIIIHISQTSIGNYKIKVPSKSMQETISTRIEENIRNNNEVREKVKKQIDNLKQLKQSLISDIVTGRLDVRGIEIPNYEKINDIEDYAILEENFEEEV